MTAFIWDEWDRKLARSIFGGEDEREVAAICEAWVEDATGVPARALSCEMSVGAVIVLELNDGGIVALKVWPADHDRKARVAQVRVQASMADRGFPAPRVFTGPSNLGPGMAMLMAHDCSGDLTDVRQPGVRDAMARGLASFVAHAVAHLDETDLPDWRVRPEEPLWPKPHNVLFDFEATARGAEWIDAIAAPARQRMLTAASPLVIGHGDWSAKNMRMGKQEIAVVYDWDSIIRAPETFVVGAAAAHFPVTWYLPVAETPEVNEMAAFIAAYEAARGHGFSDNDFEEIAAYATFSRAYKARCEHCGDGPWGGSRATLKSLEPWGGYTVSMLKTVAA